MQPKISVITGVYNGERFLKATIDSILSQTFTDFEFILVNDGSTDSSAAMLEAYRQRDARIVFVTQENVGIAATLNRAIAEARGEWVAHIDQDDIALPNWLESQYSFLQKHPECSVVCSFAYFINGKGKRLGRSKNPVDVERGIAERNPNLFLDVIHSTVVMNRRDLLALNGYRQGFIGAEDRELWGRFVTAGKMIRCNPELLVEYRLHGQSATVNKLKLSELNSRRGINVNIVRRLEGLHELNSEEIGEWFANRPMLEVIKENRRVSSVRYFQRATRHYADGRWVRCAYALGVAAAIRPVYVVRRAMQKVG